MGDLAARLGHVERAVQAYEAALAADSTYHHARHNLAVLEADRGHLPLAIELLEHIPTYVPALRTLPLFYAKQGHYDLAEKGLHTALEVGGENIDVRHQLGRLYLRQGRYDEARAALDLALAQDSTHAESHRLLGLLHLAERRYPEALAAFRHALALAPHLIEAHYNLSSALLAQGQPTQAQAALAHFETLSAHAAQVAHLRRQLDADPDHRETRLQLAHHYRQLGRDDDALTHYRAALLADPDDLEALIALSGLLSARGADQEVLELCRRGIAQHPEDERTNKLHFTRGYVYMRRNQYREARTAFERALALDSSSATAWNNLGHVQLSLGEQAAAQRALESAIAADSTLADAHYNLGSLFLQKGQLNRAQRAYRAAIAADSTFARTYYALATRVPSPRRDLGGATLLPNLYRHLARRPRLPAPSPRAARPTAESLDMSILVLLLCFLCLACNSAEETAPPAPLQHTAAAVSSLRFVEVASTVGLTWQHENGRSPKRHFPETMGGGGAFFDYDGDGDLDVYAVNGAFIAADSQDAAPVNSLFRNDGQHFVPVTAGVAHRGVGMGVAAADYDSDGDLDLYLTNFGPNALFRNDDGHFAEIGRQTGVADVRWGTSCAFADYDRDGDLDLYVANYVAYDPAAARADQVPYMAGYESYGGQAPVGYPHPDNFQGQTDLLFRNDGAGHFADVSKGAGIADASGKGLGVVFGDYDRDGWPDIYVANDAVRNFLYHNNRDGTFVERAGLAGVAYGQDGQMEAGMGVDWGDYNGDGVLDLTVTNFQAEPNALYRGEGSFFSVATFAAGIGLPSLPFLGFGHPVFRPRPRWRSRPVCRQRPRPRQRPRH